MFDTTDGLFHFVFANRDDDYYTSTYLKIKFLPYLRYNILKSGYRYVYLFDRQKHNGFEEYIMQCIGSLSENILKREPKKSIFSRWGSGYSTPEPKCDYEIRQYELDRNGLEEKINKIFNLMQKKSFIAVVIPLDIFYEFGEQENFRQVLSELKKRSRNNIIILTASVDAAENDQFLKNTFIEYPRNSIELNEKNIFFCKSVFPEIVEAFSEYGKMPFRIPTYEILQEVLGNRMQVWNDLSYNTIYIAVKYYFMHNMEIDQMKKVEDYTKIIWYWFNNNEFRDKYYNVNFSENPYRLVRLITESLDRNDVRIRIEEIAQNEPYINEDDITDVQNYIYDGCNEPDIVTSLKEYRGLLREHKDILSEEEIRKLLSITAEFEKPSYLCWKNSRKPAYCRFKDTENRNIIKGFFDGLKRKKEWNRWENGAMYILYILFEMCCSDAKRQCSEDPFHNVHGKIFEKSMEALKFCMRKSEEAPYEEEEAVKFVNEIIRIFRTEDYQTIRTYKVG